jgi:hypothetical protein
VVVGVGVEVLLDQGEGVGVLLG